MKFPKNKTLLVILLVFFLIALFLLIISFSRRTSGGIQLLTDALKNKAGEPTAFQPFSNTATPTNSAQPINNALVPNPGLVPPEGQVNILVLGSDWRLNSGYRTDVVMLVSIYTKQNKITITSFPRDLYVEIPGLQDERINTAMGYGGFSLMTSTFEHNFAIHVDHYIMTTFTGFRKIVDTLGGIEIEAAQNTADRCDLSYAPHSWCSVGPGKEYLDGEKALWYSRSRYTSNDFDRTRRAQEVLIGLFKKLMSLDAISKAPELYNEFVSSVETDMTLSDFVQFLPVAASVAADSGRIQRFAVGTNEATPYTIPSSGAYVLLPNYDAIWEIVKAAVYTP
jgi:polyisoprenyl-teichoic acid--peptidoglycan teichoic acid transferase